MASHFGGIKLLGLEIFRRAGREGPREGRVGTGRQQQHRGQDNGTIIPPRKLTSPPSSTPGPPTTPLPLGEHWPLYIVQVACTCTSAIGHVQVQTFPARCSSSSPTPALPSWRPFFFPAAHHLIFSSVPKLFLNISFALLLVFINFFSLKYFHLHYRQTDRHTDKYKKVYVYSYQDRHT